MSHIEINVSNLALSRIFYDRLFKFLGYDLYQEWEQGFSYIKNGFYFVFVQTESKHLPSHYHRSKVGLNHLAFAYHDFEALLVFKKDLELAGVSLLYEDRFPHAGAVHQRALYFEDPDRIKVEVVINDKFN